ncbi:MAG: hypothetical protein IT308_09460 [Anaerolineaceae bacterium]|nr:hypothetical protein [Anaerolineaceae bacterium]
MTNKLLPKKIELQSGGVPGHQKVKKQEGRLVLQPSQEKLNKSQAQADLAALQAGKTTTADLANILARLLQRLAEEL